MSLLAGAMATLLSTGAARADDTAGRSLSLAQAARYWTPERLRSARPLDLPLTTGTPIAREAVQPALIAPSAGVSGTPPTLRVKPDFANKLFEPDPNRTGADQDAVVPQNFGSRGAQFSSSRVFPDAATTTYPYSTVGKLFFTVPGQGPSECSASVLRARIVVTAGHCVHSGKGPGAGYYTNFVFIPAYRAGTAPFGQWTASFVITTNAWINGGGAVPNTADYAMMVLPSVGGKRIGDVTGNLGYVTNSLRFNHATLLGYPGNLDDGERMHQVAAEGFEVDTQNAVLYGSDMRGGSSGGPWVQNFGVPSVGQTGGFNTLVNAIVGITSYGPVSASPLYQGSSTPDGRFISLLNLVCARQAGNC